MKPRIFISHSTDAKATDKKGQVPDLERALKAAGIEVWVDHSEVRGGDNFPKRISDALTWCNTVLLVWSERCANSAWVQEEWTNAMALQKSIIPCETDKTPLPALLASRRRIDFQDPEKGLDELFAALHIEVPDRGPQSHEEASEGIITLRSQPVPDLSSDKVQEMLKGLRFTKRRYEEVARQNHRLVIDHSTGLVWQQSGSGEGMSMAGPPHYVAKLNSETFAGYSDWRMPTLEEAMFLVEPTQNTDKLYVDPVFDPRQMVIWTADKIALWRWWAVSFGDAGCFPTRVDDLYYVRAVRSSPESGRGDR